VSARNEDFLFAQEAQALGFVNEAQVEEGFFLQKRMAEELRLDERLAVILVKRGWIAEDQARRVYARIEPGDGSDEIQGYRIVEKIGKGAMGTVYKAVHLGLHRLVAIKVLRKDLASDPTQIERLKSEAKILASLDHPNIVRALDAGEANGFPFVVMEYVEGESLKDRIAREGPLPEDDALRITRGLADALERARRMGVVHRDVKPGNVLLTKAGEPKLMDLGLAKGPIDLGLTQHGATVGTPQYISPEQAQDPKKADTRSDIYSLGASLYAMLVGRPPFEGTTLAEIITKVLYETPTPPRVLNPDVSSETGYLIERMMLKDPTLRYRTPADVVHDIDMIVGGRSIIPTGFTGNWEGYLLRRRAKRWGLAGAAATVAGVVAALGFGLYTRSVRAEHATEQAERIAVAALENTAPDRSDDEAIVRRRLDEVREAERRIGSLQPPSRERLVTRRRSLEQVADDFHRWDDLETEVERLRRSERYDDADQKIGEFVRSVPGVGESPAEVAALTVRQNLRNESAIAVASLRGEAQAITAPTWEGYLQAFREYARRLDAGWVRTEALRQARAQSAGALEALDRMNGDVLAIARDYDEAQIGDAVRRLALTGILSGFRQRRTALLDNAQRAWAALGPTFAPFGAVRDRLDARLQDVEDGVHDLVGQTWRRYAAARRTEAEVRDTQRAETALNALRTAEKAFREGGFLREENEAHDLRRDLETALHARQTKAVENYDRLVADVLRRLHEGELPDDIRRTIQDAIDDEDANWPYLGQMKELFVVPDALDSLHRMAMNQIEARPDGILGPVRLRGGGEEKRWRVLEVHRAEHAVIASVESAGKKSPPARRSLSELDVAYIADLARGAGGTLPSMEEAVALLADVPQQGDLRPELATFRRVQAALRDAKTVGALAQYVDERTRELEREQGDREQQAILELTNARERFALHQISSAYQHLSVLLDENTVLRWTRAYEENEKLIRSLMDAVKAQLSNENLAKRFPGATVTMKDRVTTIRFDFDTPEQLGVFREPPGRGLAVLEPFAPTAPVTPEASAGNLRLALLRGMDDTLTRDRPLSLPSPFDPDQPITVEFDLYTLTSPFFLAVDVDGLQVGVLSADPNSPAYAERFRYPEPILPLQKGEKPPVHAYYGRGRGVTMRAGVDFGDPPSWGWPPEVQGRAVEEAASDPKRRKDLGGNLFAFDPNEHYRVKVSRNRGRLTFTVNDKEILTMERPDWATRGQPSLRDRAIHGGTRLLQILTWTPQAIDNLQVSGTVLESWK
jgi:tRNA A-37 threonylcarbamoyl transferase component Bud32